MSGEVPEGWATARIGDVSRSFAGGTPSRSNPSFYGPGIPWLKSGEVRAGRIEGTEEQITDLGLRESSARLVRAGTPVLAMYGGGTVGTAGILTIDAAVNQAVLAIEPDATRLNSEFCYYFLCSANRRLLSLIQGSGQSNLSKTIVDAVEICLPPLDEQQRITSVLRSMDEAISLAKSAHSKADAVLSQSREVATGLSLEPPDWERGPVLDFFQLQRGHDLPVQDRKGGDVPVIASNGTVGFHNVSAATKPAVVTGRSGTIGKVNYFDGPCWPLNTTLYVKNFKGSCPRYVYHFLSAFPLADYATGTGVPTLNRNDVHVVEVPWPSVAEQRSIAAALDAIEETVHAAEREVLALMALKSNVADDLFTGRVRVPA